MIRTFIAVEVPEAVRRSVAGIQEELKRALPPRQQDTVLRLQWVCPESLHVTLKFLGDIDEAQVEPLRASITQALQTWSPFSVTVETLGAFPDSRAPRVIWAGLRAGTPQHPLIQLASALEQALVPLGFPTEGKSFSPHLTLARVKGGARSIGQILHSRGYTQLGQRDTLGTLPVESVALIKSDLSPAGSVYTRLFAVPLGKSGNHRASQ